MTNHDINNLNNLNVQNINANNIVTPTLGVTGEATVSLLTVADIDVSHGVQINGALNMLSNPIQNVSTLTATDINATNFTVSGTFTAVDLIASHDVNVGNDLHVTGATSSGSLTVTGTSALNSLTASSGVFSGNVTCKNLFANDPTSVIASSNLVRANNSVNAPFIDFLASPFTPTALSVGATNAKG